MWGTVVTKRVIIVDGRYTLDDTYTRFAIDTSNINGCEEYYAQGNFLLKVFLKDNTLANNLLYVKMTMEDFVEAWIGNEQKSN